MNPLIVRYRESQARSQTNLVYGGIYFVIVVLLCVVALPSEGHDYTDHALDRTPLQQFAVTLYAELWFLQVLLFLVQLVLTARVIPREIERRSYDFFRLLPLSPHQKALGIAVGASRPILGFLALNLALHSLVLLFTGHSLALHLRLNLVTLFAGVFLTLLGLLFSTAGRGASTGRAGAIRVMLLAALAFTLLPVVTVVMGQLTGKYHQPTLEASSGFFGLAMPVSVLMLLVLSYLVGWTYLGILRRLRHEAVALFTRTGGAVFLGGWSLISLGLVWKVGPVTRQQELTSTAWLVALTTVPLVLTTVAARIERSGYLELRQDCGFPLSQLWPKISNLSSALLFALVVFTAQFIGTLQLDTSGGSVGLVVVEAVTYAFLALLFELYTLVEHRSAHATLLLSAVLFVYVVFPAVASASTGDKLFLLSGIDTLFVLVEHSDGSQYYPLVVLVIHGLYCLGLGALVLREYKRLGELASRLSAPTALRS
jgi:hypothetical protein